MFTVAALTLAITTQPSQSHQRNKRKRGTKNGVRGGLRPIKRRRSP
jgi:hypothetical protein